jgi:hypothetical protein
LIPTFSQGSITDTLLRKISGRPSNNSSSGGEVITFSSGGATPHSNNW